MPSQVAEQYVRLFREDAPVRKALFACSAALRLDDGVAREAIALVAQSNGSTDELLRQIKSLGCVWQQEDGSWHISEGVRADFVSLLSGDVPEQTHLHLRELLAKHADLLAETLPPDGHITEHRRLQAKFEAAYQRMMHPEEVEGGATQLVNIWQESPGAVKEAIAESVDHLARELPRVPVEVLYIQGMAAHARRDKVAQKKYFGEIVERGRSGPPDLVRIGDIYGAAAHLYALLIRRDRDAAERALNESIEWNISPSYKAHPLHSLGNLLADAGRRRWPEAADAYRQSLTLRGDDDVDKGRVYHSFANLLAKQGRKAEAEDNYRLSIELARDAHSRAERWHSLGNLLSSMGAEHWPEAEKAYERSFRNDRTPRGKAQVRTSWALLLTQYDDPRAWDRAESYARESLQLDKGGFKTRALYARVMADVYERRGQLDRAVEELEGLVKLNREHGVTRYENELKARIASLRARAGGRQSRRTSARRRRRTPHK